LAIYRGAGGSGDATQDAASEVLLALQAKDAAIAAEVAAETAQAAAQASAATASTAATNAGTSATSASGSASTATTQATNASNSASAASTSATNAASSASAASTSATNASNSASAASTSATNASNSASSASTSASNASTAQAAAEAARDSALSAYDNFDDRYLGAKSTAPTLDNDGNALLTGALYYNTVSGVMNVYTGSAWVAAYVSAAGVLLVANNLSDVADAPTARANLGITVTDLLENKQTIATNYTVTASKNALAVGPITINTGISATVGTGQRWLILN
jgi:hypothetical protein